MKINVRRYKKKNHTHHPKYMSLSNFEATAILWLPTEVFSYFKAKTTTKTRGSVNHWHIFKCRWYETYQNYSSNQTWENSCKRFCLMDMFPVKSVRTVFVPGPCPLWQWPARDLEEASSFCPTSFMGKLSCSLIPSFQG